MAHTEGPWFERIARDGGQWTVRFHPPKVWPKAWPSIVTTRGGGGWMVRTSYRDLQPTATTAYLQMSENMDVHSEELMGQHLVVDRIAAIYHFSENGYDKVFVNYDPVTGTHAVAIIRHPRSV